MSGGVLSDRAVNKTRSLPSRSLLSSGHLQINKWKNYCQMMPDSTEQYIKQSKGW